MTTINTAAEFTGWYNNDGHNRAPIVILIDDVDVDVFDKGAKEFIICSKNDFAANERFWKPKSYNMAMLDDGVGYLLGPANERNGYKHRMIAAYMTRSTFQNNILNKKLFWKENRPAEMIKTDWAAIDGALSLGINNKPSIFYDSYENALVLRMGEGDPLILKALPVDNILGECVLINETVRAVYYEYKGIEIKIRKRRAEEE